MNQTRIRGFGCKLTLMSTFSASFFRADYKFSHTVLKPGTMEERHLLLCDLKKDQAARVQVRSSTEMGPVGF